MTADNLKRRLTVGPEYRCDEVDGGIEIWPALTRPEIAEVMAEAAERIIVLETEAQCDAEYMDNMRAKISALNAENAALREQVEKAREALEPFANRAGKLDGLWDESDTSWSPVYGATAITIGDLRRARRTMEDILREQAQRPVLRLARRAAGRTEQ